MVGVRRLELPTSSTPYWRASQLRHTPTNKRLKLEGNGKSKSH
jgi:hypothetical protein